MLIENLLDGYYHLYNPSEEEPVLVHLYFNRDADCRGFGFNIHDGGGFLPLSDIHPETRIVAVNINERVVE